jgi:hypothetical protein
MRPYLHQWPEVGWVTVSWAEPAKAEMSAKRAKKGIIMTVDQLVYGLI